MFRRGEAKIGTAKAASEGTITGSDLLVRPLLRVAELLEMEGANPYRVRAYRTAGEVVRGLAKPVAVMVGERENLTLLPGIGRDLAGKIEEVDQTFLAGISLLAWARAVESPRALAS